MSADLLLNKKASVRALGLMKRQRKPHFDSCVLFLLKKCI